MAIVLGPTQYGKAECRLVRIVRDTARHEIRDLNVSTSLRGDFAAAHICGDQSRVLPTDTQKNTVYALAKSHGVGEPEEFALLLARHFVGGTESVDAARIAIEEFAWERIGEHDHSFVRRGQEVRTAAVTVSGSDAWVVSGIADLVVLKSTGSEFAGFLVDAFTTLPETHDRVLATALSVQWRYARLDVDWASVYAGVRRLLLQAFAETHSLALQQTLYAMGHAVLEERAEIAEIRLVAPNKHHFVVDLAPFGLDNPGEVFHAADRPYGLIEATVIRDDAPDPGPAWL
ncbi:MAG: urate oxidase [Geodermatophilaceae bacterium]|nr:urate oxidase [Geodermatophilaceae bacterium]